MPRSLWFVDEVKRSPAGKPDYRWAKDQTEERPADDVHAKHVGRNLMRTELCDRFGIEYPIFVFTPSEKVAAAVTRAGGLGVLGCVRFNDADDLKRYWSGWTRTPTASLRRRHRDAGQGADRGHGASTSTS